MRLAHDEVDLFFRLSTALLLHANRQLRVLPRVDSRAAFAKAPLQDKTTLRDALYDHPELLDAFVAENPDGLSAQELAEVRSWKRCVRGSFYIVRFLKRYTVFLDTASPARAYGVLGLHDEIEDLFPGLRPPIYVQTVLLPFRERIVYDGMVQAYAVHFGPGIRGSLNETYQAAKDTRGIIERLDTLEPPASGSAHRGGRRPPSPELGPALERLAREVEGLRGGTVAVQKALSMLRAAAHLARTVAEDGDDPVALERASRRTFTALARLEAVLHRSAAWGEAE